MGKSNSLKSSSEVFSKHEKSAFSLSCVFLEMMSIMSSENIVLKNDSQNKMGEENFSYISSDKSCSLIKLVTMFHFSNDLVNSN